MWNSNMPEADILSVIQATSLGRIRALWMLARRPLAHSLLWLVHKRLDLTGSFVNRFGFDIPQFLSCCRIRSFFIPSQYAVGALPLIGRDGVIIGRFFNWIIEWAEHLRQLLDVLWRRGQWHLTFMVIFGHGAIQIHWDVRIVIRLKIGAFGCIDNICRPLYTLNDLRVLVSCHQRCKIIVLLHRVRGLLVSHCLKWRSPLQCRQWYRSWTLASIATRLRIWERVLDELFVCRVKQGPSIHYILNVLWLKLIANYLVSFKHIIWLLKLKIETASEALHGFILHLQLISL